MRTKVTAVLATAFVLFVGVPIAAAQQYPPDAPSVSVSDSTVAPGESIVLTGERWQGGASIVLTFHSAAVSLGSVTARPDGSFSTSVTIPSSAAPGAHQILATGTASSGATRTVATDLTVLGTVTPPGGTAFTGSRLQVWMVAGVVLLFVGLALIVLGRRRSRVSS